MAAQLSPNNTHAHPWAFGTPAGDNIVVECYGAKHCILFDDVCGDENQGLLAESGPLRPNYMIALMRWPPSRCCTYPSVPLGFAESLLCISHGKMVVVVVVIVDPE